MNLRHLDTLRRHAFERPGFTLVNYAEVAIPHYIVNVDVLVQTRKSLPAIDEFVLASIDAGVQETSEICEFLGLEGSLVERSVIGHWNLDHVDEQSREGVRRLVLTAQGKQTLTDLKAVKPERMELTLTFDRLLWNPVLVHPADLDHPIDIRDAQVHEVRAVRPHKPGLEDVSVERVNPVLKEFMRSRDINVDILAVLSVLRTERRYLPGILLVYQGSTSSDVDVAVSVDGRISQAHTTALNRAGGLSWLELELDTATDPAQELRFDASLVRRLPPEAAETALHARVAQAEAAIASEGDSDVGPPEEAPPRREELAEAKAELDALALRRVPVFEHPILLRDALRNTRQRLLIVSPWIKRGVVNQDFLDALERLSRDGVRVTIGYGLHDARFGGPSDDVDAVKALEGLSRRFESFSLLKLGNTHEKILISDNTWITTSFNWLSFRGDPRRTIRREAGILVRDRALADKAYADFLAELDPSTPPKSAHSDAPGPRAWSPDGGFL